MTEKGVWERVRYRLPAGRSVIFVALMLTATLFLFSHAGNYYLWEDEGETALLGRNVLAYGLPYGFDGRNLYEFRNGLCLNRDFLPALTPWLQYYWAAGSLFLFGDGTFGARALFIWAGLFSLILFYFFVRRYFDNARLALISLVLMATSVPTLLFLRQCRYYALVMLLTAAVALLYTCYAGKRHHVVLSCLLFVLLFFANPLVALPALAALGISFFLFDDQRKTLRFFLVPAPFVLCVMGVFFFWIYRGGLPTRPEIFANSHPGDFFRVAMLYFRDYNLVQLLPVGLICLLVLLWIKDVIGGQSGGRRQLRREWAILAIVFIFTTILSCLSPQDSGEAHSDIRYATPLFPFLLLTQAIAVERLHLWRKGIAYLLLALLIFTNLLTFTAARFYLYEYVEEIAATRDNATKAAVRFLDNRAVQDELILVSPNHMLGAMEFYIGDKLRFCHVIGEDNRNLLAAGVKLPCYTYSSATVPDWIVLFGLSPDLPHVLRRLETLNPADYKMYRLPIYGPDVSRPELFWRSFRPMTHFRPDQGLIILRHIGR